jgi:murein L,D-transpeptidase YafK
VPVEATAAEPVECARIEFIEIVKSERRLTARCVGGGVLRMTAALSREPTGPKRETGDQRIPEGLYRIAGNARPSRFHLYIPIDYPSLHDADRALAEGAISAAVHRRIAAAHEEGRMPPQDTKLGGGLGLHGEGERWRGDSPYHDWTVGCVALADEDIDRIAALAPVGTPVEIRP